MTYQSQHKINQSNKSGNSDSIAGFSDDESYCEVKNKLIDDDEISYN